MSEVLPAQPAYHVEGRGFKKRHLFAAIWGHVFRSVSIAYQLCHAVDKRCQHQEHDQDEQTCQKDATSYLSSGVYCLRGYNKGEETCDGRRYPPARRIIFDKNIGCGRVLYGTAF